jgi:riboflavin synthase
MFTGLVQELGTVEKILPGPMTEMWLHAPLLAREPFVLGESIAINGTCLTVVEAKGESFRAQVSPETLRRTTLGALVPSSRANLERAMRMSDRLGGHLVQGHVDGVGRVLERRAEGGSVVMRFSLPPELAPYVVEKGSIAVDGVSLTVNAVGAADFSVALIPETLARTTLGQRAVGDAVNLETDLVGKYVARMLGPRAPAGLNEARLRQAGFASGSES